MKVLMLWKYPQEYFLYFYRKDPFADNLLFQEHKRRIFDDHFGWPAGLCRHMKSRGIDAEFVIVNAQSLQKQWARENNFSSYNERNWEKNIAMEQIRRFRPDIFWIGSFFDYYGAFIKEALSYSKKAITWVGSPFIKKADVSGFSVLLTENPDTFRCIQDRFKKVIVTRPGFDPQVLKKIGPVEKKYELTFIGGISPSHTKRAGILAYLIKNGVKLKVFGYIHEYAGNNFFKRIFFKKEYQDNSRLIKSVHQGPVYGLDMYRALGASKAALNVHIDMAGNNAGNMRLFEATGSGACLLTEHAGNINKFFTPGEEIITYKSKEELLGIIQNMGKGRSRIEDIAGAGQQRTLRSHTIENMLNDVLPAFDM